jgi:hypothetical protein
MVTHYADLIEAAHDNLATAVVRTRHPAASPTAVSPAHLADLADALAHLGATIGTTGHPARDLHTALRALARVDLDPTRHDHTDPRGPALDLAEATIAVRVAAAPSRWGQPTVSRPPDDARCTRDSRVDDATHRPGPSAGAADQPGVALHARQAAEVGQVGTA